MSYFHIKIISLKMTVLQLASNAPLKQKQHHLTIHVKTVNPLIVRTCREKVMKDRPNYKMRI